MGIRTPAPVEPTVVLFDVDGTLVDTGGAGRRAIVQALGEHLGEVPAGSAPIDDEPHRAAEALRFGFGGMTDRAIVSSALTAAGEPDDLDRVNAVIARYTELLEATVATSPRYRLLPGVIAILDALRDVKGIALGLGTGNVEVGARIKLARGGISDRFAFGGFGCDDADRARLIAAGARRGAERLDRPWPGCRTVIIGDTPRDVAAARDNGAESIAVATGTHTRDQLAPCGATALFDDLTAPGVLEAIFGAPPAG